MNTHTLSAEAAEVSSFGVATLQDSTISVTGPNVDKGHQEGLIYWRLYDSLSGLVFGRRVKKTEAIGQMNLKRSSQCSSIPHIRNPPEQPHFVGALSPPGL